MDCHVGGFGDWVGMRGDITQAAASTCQWQQVAKEEKAMSFPAGSVLILMTWQ